jgi:hypothetical protein
MGHMAHPRSMQSIGGTGFQPVHLHRQDAGAIKTFSGQCTYKWTPMISKQSPSLKKRL